MYNLDNETIPSVLPVHETTLLKPWFSSSLLEQGLQLLRDKRISHFHCIRDTTGGFLDQESPLLIRFEKNSKLHQGFALPYHHCSQCGLESRRNACNHLAALAILSLSNQRKSRNTLPLPIQFAHSHWYRIGHFFESWLGQTTISVELSRQNDCCLWQITPRKTEGKVSFMLPVSWTNLGEYLLPLGGQGGKTRSTESLHKGIALLENQLLQLTMTNDERLLASKGKRSIGLRKETSFWTWLARMLFLLHGETVPNIQRNPETGLFHLKLGQNNETGSLDIDLPRDKTWEFVRTMHDILPDIPLIPSARECFNVFFIEDNQLDVHPSLRLADGRILSRHELQKDKFFTAYYLENEGFLPTSRIPAEGMISRPGEQETNMPLLGFLNKEENKDKPFSVLANDLPAFLKKNRRALHHPDNNVAPELLELQMSELPDRLIIDSFEEKDDWCYLSCHYGIGNRAIPLADIVAARRDKLSHLSGKTWLQLNDTPLSWFHELTADRLEGDGDGRIRLTSRDLLALTSIIGEFQITDPRKDSRRQLASLLDSSTWTDESTLTDVPPHLRKYQRNGLAWLRRLNLLGIGGLLADDMGLGKTHQGLALLQTALDKGAKLPMLVVAPSSVILNWAEKIDTYYSTLHYELYYGQGRILSDTAVPKVILTTYGIVRQDQDVLSAKSFDIILLDEIQHAKNSQTATHKAVSALNGRVKIGLTGTPVENSLQDLRALFDICLPGLLGSERSFQNLYATPIENGHTEARDRLGRLIHPFILRRGRSQVLTELPEIIEDDRLCELSDDQIGLYRKVLEEHEQELEELEEGSGDASYMNILATISKLKRICCHPCLVTDCNEGRLLESGKWDLFVELTDELLSAGIKFVVFSQYTSMLAIIEEYLQSQNIAFASLKGDMPATTRQKMISTFNSSDGCKVFCASLLAGGVGIDLTGAQAVIHYDRWWNPAREEQATARVHRMGQKNVVQVFRLITQGTLEEKIHHLISKKRKLADALIQEDDAGIIKSLDRNELAELLRP